MMGKRGGAVWVLPVLPLFLLVVLCRRVVCVRRVGDPSVLNPCFHDVLVLVGRDAFYVVDGNHTGVVYRAGGVVDLVADAVGSFVAGCGVDRQVKCVVGPQETV